MGWLVEYITMGMGSVDVACDTSDWDNCVVGRGWWLSSRRLLAKLDCATSQDGTRLFSLLKPESSVSELVATIIRKRVRLRRRKRRDAAKKTPQTLCMRPSPTPRKNNHSFVPTDTAKRWHNSAQLMSLLEKFVKTCKARRDPDGRWGAHGLRALPSSLLGYEQLFLFLFIFEF